MQLEKEKYSVRFPAEIPIFYEFWSIQRISIHEIRTLARYNCLVKSLGYEFCRLCYIGGLHCAGFILKPLFIIFLCSFI